MNFPFYSFGKTDTEVDEAKQYAESQLNLKNSITPCLTLYNGGQKILSVYFPESQDRRLQFKEVSFLVSAFRSDLIRLIVDTTVPTSTINPIADTRDATTDVALCVMANNEGMFIVPFPYFLHPENQGPIWHDENVVVQAKTFIQSNPVLLSFTSSLFMLGSNIVPWKYYLEYLKHKNYDINFHHPYTETTIGYGLLSVF